MTILFAAAALAQSPLRVSTLPVPIANAGLTADVAPADGVPDGWTVAAQSGTLRVVPGKEANTAALSWTAGTKASLCSAPVAVPEGATLRLHSRVKGSVALEDVTAVHMHIAGPKGELHTARRRMDIGTFPWENLDILSTVPPSGNEAWVCVEVQMQRAEAAGQLSLAPFTLEAMSAESREPKLPIRRVIVVTIEAFRRDHVSAYGYPRSTTPNLDALIAEGVSFDQHYVPAPYTHPSLASLITGQLPVTLGFVDNIPSLGKSFPTAAELMSQAGYVTAAFNVQYVLSNRYGLNRGFHYYRNHPNDTPANVLNDELLPFLTAHAADNVFAWVHYFDPHGPYRPPLRFRTLFDDDAVWAADPMRVERGEVAEGAPTVPKYIFDTNQNERRHYVAAYDGDIAFTDAELGRLVAYLRASNQDDTLLVVTADHGESMTDHGRYFCHGSLYDHDLHVPFVVWGPGLVAGGQHSDMLTSHVDVLPTLLDYAGAGQLPGFAGVSLRPVLEGKPAPARDWVTSVVGRAENLRYALHAPGGLKVLTDAYGSLLQAFDVKVDPEELNELTGKDRAPAKALAKKFAAWRRSTTTTKVKPQTLDKEDEERLRALGYIE